MSTALIGLCGLFVIALFLAERAIRALAAALFALFRQ